MKSRVSFLLHVIIISLAPDILFSQGEAAVPFLNLPYSPEQAAIGGAGSSLPTDDVFGFLYNPAHLGYTSQKNNLSFISYPGKIDWLGIEEVTVSAFALNAGYNFKELIGVPLSLGFGYTRPEVNFGKFIIRDPLSDFIASFDSKDSFEAYSFGAGIDYFVQFYAGITLKNITSELGYVFINGERKGIAEINATDYGFLLNVPVVKLVDKNFNFNFIGNSIAKPFLNISFGTAFSNIGDEIYYVDPSQADPMPRTVRAGYGISAGLDLPDEKNINVFSFNFTVDAEDMLIDKSDGKLSYQSGFGDIDIGKNIIGITGDEKVIARTGLSLGLLETLVLKTGHFSGRGYNSIQETDGFEIRLKGLFKLLSNSNTMKYAADHVDIRYYQSTYLSGGQVETDIKGIAFMISGFSF